MFSVRIWKKSGCSYWLCLWKVGPTEHAWQDLRSPSFLQFAYSVSYSLSLCRRQTAPGPALPSSDRANQPRASALVPFPVSACTLPALTVGQLSAVRPTLPLQTTIKNPLFWAGGEKWEETDAPYTKTCFPPSTSKQHTGSLAAPPQISAWVLHWRTTWVNWHWCWLSAYQARWLKALPSNHTPGFPAIMKNNFVLYV